MRGLSFVKYLGSLSYECCCLGGKKELPDIAIEVVLSSGLVNKLEIYRGLGIPEV
ncbi:MAG: hypothetical protein HC924_14225 [Synechococcaceae cyanobacterium SM2_3_2]|nr:hypothetical protein [Synechococcaceae cyanobacterium SM2_3_2]